MRKRKVMSAAALIMAGTLTLQSVQWPTFRVFADEMEDTNEIVSSEEYIGNISAYDLWDVAVTDSYLVNAEAKDVEYLLKLDADRLLAGFRETAGLDMKGKTRYGGGWEDALIGGHTMGHYLTAMAQAIAELPDSDARKAKVEEKLNYIIAELEKCQNQTGTGFIFGARILDKNNIELQFDNVEKGLAGDIGNQAWVPWYTMHKVLAGLIDTYKYTGNETALSVAKKLGDWVYARASKWDAATQNRVLAIEYGGMNDCLYELYAVTNEENYAKAAHKFDEENLFKLVASDSQNALNNKHANTTIPKFLGALNRYVTTNGKTVNGETVNAEEYLAYAEKFFDIKCRYGGLSPDCVVLVATIKALKYNGGAAKTDLAKENMWALEKGIVNLGTHIENMHKYHLPVVVAINKFATDTEEEIKFVQNFCAEAGVEVSMCEVFAKGSEGGIDLAEKVCETIELCTDCKTNFRMLYNSEMSLKDKIETIASEVYRADGVNYTAQAEKAIKEIESVGFRDLPVCIAKTQYSLSDNPSLLGKPKNFHITVRDAKLSSGAGFVVIYTGDIMTMPGLPKVPAALNIDCDNKGNITGLF